MLVSGFYPFPPSTIVAPTTAALTIASDPLGGVAENAIPVTQAVLTITEKTPVIPTTTLSGEFVSAWELGAQSTAGIRFNSDGTVDKNDDGTYSQVDSATDWIIPNASAPSDYQIRVTATPPGNDFTSEPAVPGTWVTLDSNREWQVQTSSPSSFLDTGYFTVEIRKGSGPVEASGSYRLRAEHIV